LYKYDNKRWVLEIYKKDDLIDSYYIDVEELENQETGIGKKMYISYSNSQGSGILIPEMVQVKVFNVIKMDNPKLYFGENVYDYQVAHNKFSEEFGYSNGGGVENAEMPTRERTTITRPTTTPTTTPSKPDKDNPYKPKIKTRPKASKYDFILINK
jgi:hypothetical protein